MSRLGMVLEQLRARGERLTVQRRLVLEALCSRADHMTIGDIRRYAREKHRGDDLPEPTVYRILQWLKDLRLVSQTDMGEAGTVYELIDNPPHHHLICLSCGAVIDLDDRYFDALRGQLRDAYGFAARIDHMAVYGLCRDCQAKRADASRDTASI